MTEGNYDPNAGAYPAGRPPGGVEPGDLWIRFAARVIDAVIVYIVSVGLVLALGLFSNYWVSGLFYGLIPFIYFLAFEGTQGWTPGKKILGLHVLGAGGAPKPTVQEAAIRNSFLLLSIIPFIGFLLALAAWIVIAVTINSSPTKQGKHDELAGGTQVVKDV